MPAFPASPLHRQGPIGVLGIDEPNSFVDPKTRDFIGYEIDLAKEVVEKIGIKFVSVTKPVTTGI